jgi:hypothetical protein
MNQTQFTYDFKKSFFQRLLNETAGPVKLCRRYNIASAALNLGKTLANGRLDPEDIAGDRVGGPGLWA